jgi:ABC-2 type transport system ATP-binding protein
MTPAVETRGLTRRFGRFVAVDDLSLVIEPGEIFGLLGSNGAGKSTAIRMLCGLLTPSGGEARVLGLDVARRPEQVKRLIGYMTQRFSLYDDLTVRQNLRFYGGVYGLRGADLADRVARAIGDAGLEGREDRPTGALPAGAKQSLALACAVLHGPRVVFLDEPTGGVDPVSRRRFWRRIDDLAAAGTTVIVTTHYLDEAEHCGRIALLHAGRLVAAGTVASLKDVFAGRVILEVIVPRPLEALAVLDDSPAVLEAALFGDRLHVVVESADTGGAAVLERLRSAGQGPATAGRIVPSLEDVFIHAIEAAEARSAPGGPVAAARP